MKKKQQKQIKQKQKSAVCVLGRASPSLDESTIPSIESIDDETLKSFYTRDASHVAEIMDTILNSDKIIFNSEEASKLIPVTSNASSDAQGTTEQSKLDSASSVITYSGKNKFQYVDYQTSQPTSEQTTEKTTEMPSKLQEADLEAASSDLVSETSNTASISQMNETFNEMFSRPRNQDYSLDLKEKARENILSRFKEYGLEANIQSFTATKNGIQYKGKNLIGILPGKYRNTKGKDMLVVVAAHYDTVRNSPGVDDNGSGMVAVLEVARLISAMPQLNHSLMFVAFDLEENGLLGSMSFVKEYLIPRELIDGQAKFLGAYVIDMALNYESSENSQKIPSDMAEVSTLLLSGPCICMLF